MTQAQQKPFGSWLSAISPELVAGKTLRFGSLQSAASFVYWTECRPAEKGRCVIMRCDTASPSPKAEELLPSPFSTRSQVHEYGGGEFMINHETLYFINAEDQQIYRLVIGQAPEKITDEPDLRFTDMCMDAQKNILFCVCEKHFPSSQGETPRHPDNFLVAISLDTPIKQRVKVLVQGHDFYASPTLSPDGKKLAWISWNLPDMPWDSAALHVATIGDTAQISDIAQIAGDGSNSIFQPQWDTTGKLYFIWDKQGWQQLYCWQGENIADQPTLITDQSYDFGQPQWVFGMKKYAILPDNNLALCFSDNGTAGIAHLDTTTHKFTKMNPETFAITELEQVVPTPKGFAALCLSHNQPQAIIEIDFSAKKTNILRLGSDETLEAGMVSKGQPIQFSNSQGQTVFATFYPPANTKFKGTKDSLPPCIFNAHGGPTASAKKGLDLKVQYWTSRGFAWCNVDYSGSTGYGRQYRQRLDGQWGIADADDLNCAAKHLIDNQKVHEKQCIITGSSAGGLTVLLALATNNIFAAGSSYYGVTDLLKLQETTHKFEAGYLLRLIGCTEKNYQQTLPARSPNTVADKITAPVIFFQGDKDNVVPLEQAKLMSAALKKRNIPTQLYIFEGEGHGFRQSETIITTLKKEYEFYRQIFGF